MLVRCLFAMGLFFCIQLKAQDNETLTNDSFPIQILASDSVIELLRTFPTESEEALELLKQSKNLNQKDQFWQQIIFNATQNSLIKVISALQNLGKCFVASVSRGSYEILSKDSGKFCKLRLIMPARIANIIAKTLALVSANGDTNTSYEILFRPSENHIWAIKLSPKKITKFYFFMEENLAITVEDWRHIIFLDAN